ncbi:hypothetical protein [Actinocorallia longicatena]|uniref:DUF4435 domain-containing protein n=1 Tax=Actinocorallia longicatena TaxID=111803 RepID=A0ABP6Q9W9_9ACTN
MRRDVAAILIAHKFDPLRRELYVEGKKDRVFLEWATGTRKSDQALIIQIEFVDIPDCPTGGNRSRLLKFLSQVQGEAADIRGLVDADSDRLKDVIPTYPDNVWVTDWRSIESYVMTEECLDAALRLGGSIDSIDAKSALRNVMVVARWLAAVRFASESNDFRLSVSEAKWAKYIKCQPGGTLTVDQESIIVSLCQKAGISLAKASLDSVVGAIKEAEERLAKLDDLHVVHGKDFMKILTILLDRFTVNVDDAGRLLWPAFQRERLSEYPALAEVVEYLTVSTLSA